MAIQGAFRELFGRRKDFIGIVGDPALNRLGLHPARIALTDACLALRRLGHAAPPELAGFARDGIAVIPDALPATVYARVRDEARAALAGAPPRPIDGGERGFGRKRPFDGGFDRFDGGTLNRFLDIEGRLPTIAAALRDRRLVRLCEHASGFRYRPARFFVYQTVHGDERANADPQRATHRDTFHSTIKLWLFLDDVGVDDGPLEYVPGSHRITQARRRWEYRRAIAASRRDAEDRSGSFRIDDAGLAELGLSPPRPVPVAANTLVIADVRGFHRRGDAPAGTERLALYANLRMPPFSPIFY